jgi:hypothetical protein
VAIASRFAEFYGNDASPHGTLISRNAQIILIVAIRPSLPTYSFQIFGREIAWFQSRRVESKQTQTKRAALTSRA